MYSWFPNRPAGFEETAPAHPDNPVVSYCFGRLAADPNSMIVPFSCHLPKSTFGVGARPRVTPPRRPLRLSGGNGKKEDTAKGQITQRKVAGHTGPKVASWGLP